MTFLTKQALLLRRRALPKRFVLALLTVMLAGMLSACGGSAHIPVATASGPQLYMTPVTYGGAGSATSTVATYSIDDTALTFRQDTYASNGGQSGPRINYAGDLASPGLARGVEELELTYSFCATGNGVCTAQTYNPPQPGSGWAVELADQGGALAQLAGQPFVPMVPAVTCPSMKSAETFLYVTLPAPLITTSTDPQKWNPQLETAYGSIDISASGSAVTLANSKQYLLPSAGGGAPANAPSSSVTGACTSTVYGNTVAVPANPTITTTSSGNTTVGPQAMMGIGPSGLLVEDNGSGSTNPPPYYENALGAGTGAIGLPKPSSALSTSSLVGAQYLGFFYSSGSSSSTTTWSSSVASFGFSSLPTSCATVVPQTPTMLYGGDFAGNNPAAPSVQLAGGFGNCDFAVDLGAQDTSTNGLFTGATVYVGTGFCLNSDGTTCIPVAQPYHFPAVAIAGQLNGKYAIFVIGEDTIGSPNQAWGIYLLQSN